MLLDITYSTQLYATLTLIDHKIHTHRLLQCAVELYNLTESRRKLIHRMYLVCKKNLVLAYPTFLPLYERIFGCG